MLFIRSLIFNILFLGIWTPAICLGFLPYVLLPISSRKALIVGKTWAHGSLFLLRICCGITHRVEGIENIPSTGPGIIASKHQSAWDTIVFFLFTDAPAYILKKELCRIPIFGMHLIRMDMIPVSRKDGASALKKMTQQAYERISAGRQLVIFPEGTRTKSGERQKLHPGIAAIYSHPDVHVPVTPVAVNSGKFWGRDSFLKHPGVITIRFLPPIAADMPRKVFMKQLENTIHDESEKL